VIWLATEHALGADIEMAKTANKPHAVHLSSLLLEAANGQHGAVSGKLLLPAEIGNGFGFSARNFLADRHWRSLRKRPAIMTGRRWAFLIPNSLNPEVTKAGGCRLGLRKTV